MTNVAKCKAKDPSTCRFHGSLAMVATYKNVSQARSIYKETLALHSNRMRHGASSIVENTADMTLVSARQNLEVAEQAYYCTPRGLVELKRKLKTEKDKMTRDKLNLQLAVVKQIVSAFDKTQDSAASQAKLAVLMKRPIASTVSNQAARDEKRTPKRVKPEHLTKVIRESSSPLSEDLLRKKVNDSFGQDPLASRRPYLDKDGNLKYID